jgi:hypothetical protein
MWAVSVPGWYFSSTHSLYYVLQVEAWAVLLRLILCLNYPELYGISLVIHFTSQFCSILLMKTLKIYLEVSSLVAVKLMVSKFSIFSLLKVHVYFS